jgi:hypothetical protein
MALTQPSYARCRIALFCCAAALLAGCTFSTTPVTFDPDASPARRLAAANFDPSRLRRLTVLVRNETGRSIVPGVLRKMDDEFSYALIGKGYELLARADLDVVLNEITLDRLGLTESRAAQIGRMVNAEAVLVVSVTSIDVCVEHATVYTGKHRPPHIQPIFCTRAAVSARLIDVSSSNVLWLASHTGEGRSWRSEDTVGLIPTVAIDVARAFPTRPNSSVTTQPASEQRH